MLLEILRVDHCHLEFFGLMTTARGSQGYLSLPKALKATHCCPSFTVTLQPQHLCVGFRVRVDISFLTDTRHLRGGEHCSFAGGVRRWVARDKTGAKRPVAVFQIRWVSKVAFDVGKFETCKLLAQVQVFGGRGKLICQ